MIAISFLISVSIGAYIVPQKRRKYHRPGVSFCKLPVALTKKPPEAAPELQFTYPLQYAPFFSVERGEGSPRWRFCFLE